MFIVEIPIQFESTSIKLILTERIELPAANRSAGDEAMFFFCVALRSLKTFSGQINNNNK